MHGTMNPTALVTALKAAAEPTRLRILLLLAQGELNVKDLTQVLGQSQPRISRHLKLLTEAGLVERFREGSWVYFHVSDRSDGGRLARRILAAADLQDPVARRDHERAEALKRDREAAAQTYFREHAADWDRIRALYVAEEEVERAMRDALGPGPFNLLVDLGTGTGRMLELFAPRFEKGLGLDVNKSMLAYARSKLTGAGLGKAEVRHGDIYALPLADSVADAVILHQVLHFLSEPTLAIREAARILAPGGRMLITDFAPHGLEELRDRQRHERLGFATEQIHHWLEEADLTVRETRDLKPTASDGRQTLTVSLWLAERPGDRAANNETPGSRQLERAKS
jgi:ubiquinone/menaquinone biosynthesis C-methylase UbiE